MTPYQLGRSFADMMYFDTHAHLTDERFDADRAALMEALPKRGLAFALDVACALQDFPKTHALTQAYSWVFGAYGVHPHYAGEVPTGYLDMIQEALDDPKAKALGEIGLDYHYDFAPRAVQCRIFAEQLELAQSLDIPVVLHIREAFGDCMDILRAHKNGLCGVMHCFSGSAEIAAECVELGLYIAFGGAVTFKNARKPLEAATYIPLERLLLETDCPYMTPVPHRGERNDPSYIPLIAQKIAQARNMEAEALMQATLDNGKRLFRL